jgi:hypothetical protein
MKRIILLGFILLTVPLSVSSETLSAWNGTTIGTSSGNMNSWNGSTLGTSSGNVNAINGASIAASCTTPTITSVTIQAGGTTAVVAFNAAVNGANTGTGFSMASWSTSGSVTMTYSSGNGTANVTYSLNKTIGEYEIGGTYSYSEATNNIVDAATGSCVLANKTATAATNSSTTLVAAVLRNNFKARVTADSGTIAASDAVLDAAYQMLIDNSLYSNCAIWCAARFAYKLSGSDFVKIYDIGSNNLDGIASGATKPQYVASTQNSLPGIAFAGAGNATVAPCFSYGSVAFPASAHSFFAIVNGDASNPAYKKVMGYATCNATGAYTTGHIVIDNNNSHYYRVYSGNDTESVLNLDSSAVDATSTTYYIPNYTTGSTYKINNFYMNATSIGAVVDNDITPTSSNRLTVGAIYDSAFTVVSCAGWVGHINEWLMLTKEYSSGERAAVLSYLNGIWAIY